jgi:hypothetical protein
MDYMRFPTTAALLAACALSACANGNQGNPGNQPYATDPAGAIAVKPQFTSTASYDPYGTPPPFADMQSGSVATAPPPQPPVYVSPPSQAPASRTRTMPRQQ